MNWIQFQQDHHQDLFPGAVKTELKVPVCSKVRPEGRPRKRVGKKGMWRWWLVTEDMKTVQYFVRLNR